MHKRVMMTLDRSPLTLNLNKVGKGFLNLNNLCRDLKQNPTYQLYKLKALWFLTRRFFLMFPYISLCKPNDPRVGPLLALGP